jgi:enoyl-CoA hydratase
MNAVDQMLHDDFSELFAMLKREGDARAIVLTGGAKRAFSAGGDFAWFPSLRSMDTLDHLRRAAKQMIWDLLDVEVPIVCALNGSAAGLGASIALLCDLIVMSDRASIIDPHVNVGLVAGDGGAAVWPLLLGPLAAKRHLLLGDPLRADEALRLGVATEVCSPADVEARALHWAERLAAQPPLALRGTKIAVNAQLKRALLDSFDLSSALEIPCFLSRDHVEAIDAITERRTPIFEGR